MMDYTALNALLTATGQKFLCRDPHAEPNEATVTFSIHHSCYASKSPERELGLVEGLSQFADFFQQVDQLWLYCQDDLNNQAFFIGGPDDWPALADDFFAWIDQLDETERIEFLPEWVQRESVLVFAEKPGAATYFLTPRRGPHQGTVFLL